MSKPKKMPQDSDDKIESSVYINANLDYSLESPVIKSKREQTYNDVAPSLYNQFDSSSQLLVNPTTEKNLNYDYSRSGYKFREYKAPLVNFLDDDDYYGEAIPKEPSSTKLEQNIILPVQT